MNLLVLQEMLLPWHALRGCKHDTQCPSSCSCVTDIPSAWSWHSDGSCLIPKHPSGCSQEPEPSWGVSLPFPSPRLWGCFSPQELLVMSDPNILQSQFPGLWGSLATFSQGHCAAGLVQNQEEKVRKVPSPETELCWRWYPMQTGISGSWSCYVCFKSRGDLKAVHNLMLQGLARLH